MYQIRHRLVHNATILPRVQVQFGTFHLQQTSTVTDATGQPSARSYLNLQLYPAPGAVGQARPRFAEPCAVGLQDDSRSLKPVHIRLNYLTKTQTAHFSLTFDDEHDV